MDASSKDRLNYATEAIEFLKESIRILRQDTYPLDAHRFVINMLSQATKFMLPDDGELYDDEEYTSDNIDVMRLPYSICALEYTAGNKPSDPEDHKSGRERCDKHISIAFDPHRLPQPLKEELLKTLDKPNLDDISSNSIAVIALYAFNENRSVIRGSEWSFASGVAFIDAENPFYESSPIRLVDAKFSFFQRNYEYDIRNGMPPEFGRMALSDNTQGAVKAALHFATAMSCSNVSTETLKPPPLVNKKRLSKGKAPLFEYHVLNLDVVHQDTHAHGSGALDFSDSAEISGGGSHASPRQHLRRGHMRRLGEKHGNKVIWVNATVVGKSHKGVIEKSYELDAPRPARRSGMRI